MKRRPTHYGLRLTCGLALLLLPAVQHKFAPKSADEARLRPRTAQHAVDDQAPSADEKHRTKTRLLLAATVPDVAPPRRPCPAHVLVVAEDKPRPAITSGGEVGPSASSENAGDYDGVALFWWWITPRVPLVLAGPLPDADLNGTRPYEHVSVGSILRTGPPRI